MVPVIPSFGLTYRAAPSHLLLKFLTILGSIVVYSNSISRYRDSYRNRLQSHLRARPPFVPLLSNWTYADLLARNRGRFDNRLDKLVILEVRNLHYWHRPRYRLWKSCALTKGEKVDWNRYKWASSRPLRQHLIKFSEDWAQRLVMPGLNELICVNEDKSGVS